MREILFRGKRVDNGDWVEGFYIQIMSFGSEYHCIFEAPNIDSFNDLNDYKVIPETVGQFTGLLDKNGTKIFEGDLAQYDAWDYPFGVIFNDEKARFVCKLKTGLTQYIDYENLVVVGDVY